MTKQINTARKKEIDLPKTEKPSYQSSDPRIQDMYGKINHLKSLADVEADYMTAEE